MTIFPCIIAASVGLLFSTAAAESLEDVQKSFSERQEALSEGHATTLKKLGTQLVAALGTARETAKKAGDLDRVKALTEEIDRWDVEEDLPIEESPLPEIAKLHSVYRAAKEDLVLKKQRATVSSYQTYDVRLEALEKALVAGDRVDDAEKVRTERDAMRDSLALKESIEAVKAADDSVAADTKGVAGKITAKEAWRSLKLVKTFKAEGNKYFTGGVKEFKDPVSVGEKEYKPRDIIYTHASGKLEYTFDEPVTGFRCGACLEDRSNQGNVIFKVETEEGEVYRSKEVKKGANRDDIEITFKPTRKLVLVIDENGWSGEDWAFLLKPEYR